jgi:predicted exporter
MRRRGLAVAIWIAGLALCLFQIAHTRFVADLSSFLPSAPTAEQRLLVDQLRDGAVSRVVLIGIEGADAPTRAQLSRALAGALSEDARFSAVANGATGGFEREAALLRDHRYALSSAVTPERFTVEGLRSAISATIAGLASGAGLVMKSLVTRDPTGETLAVIDQLRPGEGPGMSEGVWASPDAKRALLVARTRASGSDTDAQSLAVAAVEETFRKVQSEAGGTASSARLLLTGPGVFSVRARAMVEHDVVRLTGLSALIAVVLLLMVYRSPVALALGFVPVISGALAGIAAVSLGFGAVHGITLGFGTTLIGEAVDYSIYLFVQAERGDTTWIERFWPTIRLGVLTSIAGFSALLFSGLPGLAQLGVYSIAGLVVAAVVTRFVLPVLLPRTFRVRDLSPLGLRVAAVCRTLSSARWVVAAIAVGCAAVVWTHRGTLWDTELSSLNPITMEDRVLDTELRAALGASDARVMVAVHGSSADAALGAAEKIGERLDTLVAGGQLGGYESPARFLPSSQAQRARLASLPDAETLRTRLREALVGLPIRAERLEPFVEDTSRARSQGLVTREQVKGTALELAVDGLLFADSAGRWTAMLGLRPAASGAIDAAAVRGALAEAGVPGAMVLDLKTEVDRLYAGYFQRALVASAAGFAAIVLLLFAALRSPARVARVMAPFVASVLLVAAWHVLAGTRLTIFHLVGLLLVAAIGSNYSLFFDRMALSVEADTGRTLASLLLANVTTVTGFGILALSGIPVLKAIGSTVALGTFAALLFAAMTARVETGPLTRVSGAGDDIIPRGKTPT